MPEISAFCPACGRAVAGPQPFPEARGLSQDAVLGMLAYVALLPGVLFLALPTFKANRFVRFHSWQSVFFAGGTIIVAGILRLLFAMLVFIPGIGFLFAILALGLTSLAMVFLWLVLIVKAIQGDAYELPWLGGIAARLA